MMSITLKHLIPIIALIEHMIVSVIRVLNPVITTIVPPLWRIFKSTPLYPIATNLLTQYRSLLFIVFILPVGWIFDGYLQLKAAIRNAEAAPEKHEERVRRVQQDVISWRSDGSRKPMCTAKPTFMSLSTRFEPKHEWNCIDLADFTDILAFDEQEMVLHCEPGVTVGKATDYLTLRGYMLAVTLEIREATLGGLAAACGMTTMSHKVGLFQDNVIGYEVITGRGELLYCSKDEHSDLYHAIPWSHGSLGLIVGLKLRVIHAKKFVKLTYAPCRSMESYCSAIRTAAFDDSCDFVEATIFNHDEAIVMTGKFSDGDSTDIVDHSKWYMPWFYKHVESFLETDGGVELIPLSAYLLRHTRSIFWVVRDMISESIGNNLLFRWCLGWLMPPRINMIKFTTTEAVRQATFRLQTFQDITLPLSKLEDSIDAACRVFGGMYPLLVYPSRIYDNGGQVRVREEEIVPGTKYGMFFDLGIYGVPEPLRRGEKFATVHAMKDMEEFTQKVGGIPFLYADTTFHDRAEFEKMFDLTLYDRVRDKYACHGAFPDLFEKIKSEVDLHAVMKEEEEEMM